MKRDVFSDAFSESLYRAWVDVKKGKQAKFAQMLEHPLLDNKGGDGCVKKIADAEGVKEKQVFNIVLARRKRFGLDPLSDTAFSSLVRAEQMELGMGA